jgi:hypothetical protein
MAESLFPGWFPWRSEPDNSGDYRQPPEEERGK